MIRVSVLYPNGPEATFDHDYYRDKHIPLIQERCGDAVLRVEIDKGLADGTGGSPAYVAAVHLFFESVDDVRSSMGRHASEIMGDIPNYTNTQPEVVVSEVVR